MCIEQQATDRLVRNLLQSMFGGSTPTKPHDIATYCYGEWGLDTQDIATVLRFVSGECSDGQSNIKPEVTIEGPFSYSKSGTPVFTDGRIVGMIPND